MTKQTRRSLFGREFGDDTNAFVDVLRGRGRWVWCGNCNKNVRPLALNEPPIQRWPASRMMICGECGYGLEPPVDMPTVH